ncbi:MAG: universal stress protein, partial [Chloroflexi bacterium]|nr:universal stress protein [Chloroflexota bacterium]
MTAPGRQPLLAAVRRASGRREHALDPELQVPADPRLVVAGPLDPELDRIRVGLRGHRRRLWTRRIVRRAWIALAVAVGSELVLAIGVRLWPIEDGPALATLIVVGTHGRRGLARALMGSVAEATVRYARCPVVVVPPCEERPEIKIEP